MFRRAWISFQFVLVSIHSLQSGVAWGQVPLGDDAKSHFAGIADAHRANVEGWNSGDVLFRVEVTADLTLFDTETGQKIVGPNSETMLTRTAQLYRVVFDFPSKRYLIMRRGSSKKDGFDSLDEPINSESATKDFMQLVLVDPANDVALVKLKPGVVSKFKNRKEFEFQAELAGVPMIPGFGISPPSGSWNLSTLLRDFQRVTTRDQISKVEHVGDDRYRVSREFLREAGTEHEVKIVVNTDWDIEHFVPVQKRVYLVSKDGKIPVKPSSEEQVEWKELNSAMVPTKLRSSTSNLVTYESKSFLREAVTNIDLYWYSMNQELAPHLFEPANLTDPDRMSQLLDESVFADEAKK
jgi:hypothetical protein